MDLERRAAADRLRDRAKTIALEQFGQPCFDLADEIGPGEDERRIVCTRLAPAQILA